MANEKNCTLNKKKKNDNTYIVHVNSDYFMLKLFRLEKFAIILFNFCIFMHFYAFLWTNKINLCHSIFMAHAM